MEIITRAEAKEKGLKRYFTGKPCKHGHISEKLVSNFSCCECSKERTSESRDKGVYKKYYQENKELIYRRTREYQKTNKDKKKIWQKKYREKNKEKIKERVKVYREKNKEKIKNKNFEYSQLNKSVLNEKLKQRNSKPIGKIKVFTRNTLCRMVVKIKQDKEISSTSSINYTPQELKEHIEKQFRDGMTWGNHGTVWHIDHIIPLSWFIEKLDGQSQEAILLNANALHNLQPLLVEENLRKGNKMPWNL